MKKIDLESRKKSRKEHNSDLIRRMRDNEPLKSFDSQASWFPPRPIIEKDKDAVTRLYGRREGEVKPKAQPVSRVTEDGCEVISFAGFNKEESETKDHNEAG